MTAEQSITTHPGEILREEFLKPHGMSANALARAIRVPPNRIAAEKPRAVTPDTALRLGRLFGTTPNFWINLQTAYDLSVAIAENGKQIESDVNPLAA